MSNIKAILLRDNKSVREILVPDNNMHRTA